MAKAKQQRKYTVSLSPKVVAQMQFHLLCLQVRHWTDGEWTWEEKEQERFFTELRTLIDRRLFPPPKPTRGTPTDAVVFTIKGLTETDVVARYWGGYRNVVRFWHNGSCFGFADSGRAVPLTKENRTSFGLMSGDLEKIQEVVRQVSGNFPGGDLGSKVGWSWLVERAEGGWNVVGERAPGAVGRRLASERAASNGGPLPPGTERKTPEIGGPRNEA